MSEQISRCKFVVSTAGSLTVALAGRTESSAGNAPREDPDSFYIKNHTNQPHKFTITIARKTGGTKVISGEYQVPASHGVEFANVGELGETYHVKVSVDGLAPLTRDWSVSKCPTGERGSNANMAGAFFIREDAKGFVQNQCSDSKVGASSELTYVTAPEVAISDDWAFVFLSA